MFAKRVFHSLAATFVGLATFGLGLALFSSFASSTISEIVATALASGIAFAAGGFVFAILGNSRPVLSGSLWSLILAGCSTTYIFGGQSRQIPWALGLWLSGLVGVWGAIQVQRSSQSRE